MFVDRRKDSDTEFQTNIEIEQRNLESIHRRDETRDFDQIWHEHTKASESNIGYASMTLTPSNRLGSIAT